MPDEITPPRSSFHIVRIDYLQAHPDVESRFTDTIPEDAGLLESIRNFGLLIPLVVTLPANGIFTVIDGYRRLACAKILGQSAVPCAVVAATSEGDYHLRRYDLNTLTKPWTQSETMAFLTRLGLTPTQAQLAARLDRVERAAYLSNWHSSR